MEITGMWRRAGKAELVFHSLKQYNIKMASFPFPIHFPF